MPDELPHHYSASALRAGEGPRRLAEREMRDRRLHGRAARAGGHLIRQLVLAALVFVLVTATTIVHADEWTGYSTPAGPYVGAGWGRFDLHLQNLNDVGTAVTDIFHSGDDAWKAFVGFRFAPFLAVEGAYVDFGHADDYFDTAGSRGVYHVSMSGFSPSAIGTLPLGPVEIFGKVGYYFYDVTTRVDFNSGPFIESRHSRSDFLYGGGLGVTLIQHLFLRAEYERLDLHNATNSDVFWLSPSWRF